MDLRDRILRAPEDGGAPGGVAPAVSAPTPAAPAAPAPAAVEAAPVTPAAAAPAVETPTPATPAESAPAAPAGDKPAEPAKEVAKEFAPSLLEEGAKPPADAKPADEGKDKPADPAKPEPAPEPAPAPSYAFTYPEGFTEAQVDKERMGAYTGVLGENNIPQEVGQKLLDMHFKDVNAVATRLAEHQWEVFNNKQNEWREEVKSDPVLGGSRHKTALQTCMSVIEQYGGNAEAREALINDFKTTGIGNNPRFLRLLHNIGVKAAIEAKPVPANPPKAPSLTTEQKQRSRYGNGASA